MFKKNKKVEVDTTPEKIEEEWIWVDGFKGTDKDMRCRDYQYEIGKQFDMPNDEKIELCESGFHMCLYLSDVFEYYGVRDSNRFFEVKALVRKSDLQKYGTRAGTTYFGFCDRVDKLAAKSIEFVSELTIDEILSDTGYDTSYWTDDEKNHVCEIGVDGTAFLAKRRVLIDLGFSETFANYLINADKFNIARVVGSQSDLSMDMKVWTIMTDK